jgi:hypothetical protein
MVSVGGHVAGPDFIVLKYLEFIKNKQINHQDKAFKLVIIF